MSLRRAAGVLIPLENDKFLFVKRKDGQGIGLPCGKVEPGETVYQAAIRECKEETGYEVHTWAGFYTSELHGWLVTIVFATCWSECKEVIPDEETVVLGLSEIPDTIYGPFARQAIGEWYRFKHES